MKHLVLVLFTIMVGRTYSQSCIVAQFNANGNANDAISSHHGTNIGATFTTDRFNRPNQAFSFDGNNDYITVQDDNDLEGFTEMTISTWFNLPSYDYDGSAKVILQKWGTGPLKDRCYLLAFDSLNNWLWFQIYLKNANTSYLVDMPLNVLPKNQWHMLSAVYDGDSIYLYVDTILAKSKDVPNGDQIQTGNADLTIGREQGTNDFTNIKLDDIRIFNCALSKTQIDSIYFLPPCTIDTSITISNGNLISNENNAKYQWLNCSNDSILPSDTFQTFHPKINGSYAVILSMDGCTDTSSCINIKSVGIETYSQEVKVFPNPSNGLLTISNKSEMNHFIEVYNSCGEKVFSSIIITNHIDITHIPNGIYYVKMTGILSKENLHFRFIKCD